MSSIENKGKVIYLDNAATTKMSEEVKEAMDPYLEEKFGNASTMYGYGETSRQAFIGFFYRIFLSRTIGAEGLGIYQLIAPVTAICFAFTAAGIQTSISKFVSMEVGRKNDAGAKTYLSIGLFISLCLSTLCSFFLYHYADFIAVSWRSGKH